MLLRRYKKSFNQVQIRARIENKNKINFKINSKAAGEGARPTRDNFSCRNRRR